MAIFSSSTPGREGAAPEPQRRRGEPTAVSIIGKDMTITGDLETEGVIKIEGAVRGTIRAGTQVLVSPGATIDGDLHTREAVVGGQVRGTIHADERVEVQATAVIAGDIHTTRILVVEGGQVNGEIKMGEAAERRLAPGRSEEQLPAWSES
jgi:cytoskeletal protein CcmA (bactofilin family)